MKGAASPHGRYHSEPFTTLYMSPFEQWAWTALEVHTKIDDPPRVAVPIDVVGANVLDLRDHEACSACGVEIADAVSPWQDAIRRGEKPLSWAVADKIKQAGFDGLVDKSRRIPEGWHLVLFDWNTPGRPLVAFAGDAN